MSPGDTNGPRYVSQVLPAATGPFIIVDAGYMPDRLLATVPDLVVARLEEAGVTEATVACPHGPNPLVEAFSSSSVHLGLPRAVVCCLYPPPPIRGHCGPRADVPDQWLVEAVGWVTEGLAATDQLHAAVGTMEFPLAAGDALEFLHQCRKDDMAGRSKWTRAVAIFTTTLVAAGLVGVAVAPTAPRSCTSSPTPPRPSPRWPPWWRPRRGRRR